jgi:hypothetical protein
VHISLEPCPTCGYAFSAIGNHCRHCVPTFLAPIARRPFDPKHLPQVIAVVIVLSICVYLIFFR